MNKLYKNYRVKFPFKVLFIDVFTNKKETKTFSTGDTLIGRIDDISKGENKKTYLVLEDGYGAEIDSDCLEIIT